MSVHSTYSVIVQESLCLFMRDVGHMQMRNIQSTYVAGTTDSCQKMSSGVCFLI